MCGRRNGLGPREAVTGSDRVDRAAQAARRQRHSGVAAAPAETVDLQAMTRRSEPVFLRDAGLDLLDLLAAELGHRAALQADQVLVYGLARQAVLVALEAF